MKMYQAKVVKEINAFYGDLLYALDKFPTIISHLEALTHRMYEGVRSKTDCVFIEINNYHKDHLGKPIGALQTLNLSLEDCKMTIANEYGFQNWSALEQEGNKSYSIPFEQAVNAVLSGDLQLLKVLLQQYPKLIHQRSQYGHQATLLHYTASNGVEFWRQKVPLDLVEVTEYLLDCGANHDAKMRVYGGEFNTFALLKTSAHPRQAGLLEGMENLLLKE